MSRSYRGVLAVLLLGALPALPAWSMHWPWHRHPAAAVAAAPVIAVAVSLDAPRAAAPRSPALPQHWDGNTLLLDLSQLSGEGSATLRPYAGVGWPVRMEFRVQPGRLARLDVRSAQRVVFFVPAQGAPQLLKLDPGVYVANSARITLHWSAAEGSAP